MMLGESQFFNPTVKVPPWPPSDDLTAASYSPLPVSGVAVNHDGNADHHNPYGLHEALTALQRYLPSNEPDFDSDSDPLMDAPVDAYSCDHFRMYEFKVRRCARGRSHDWTECPYAHPGEKARRRDPRKYHYSGTACPDFRKGSCKKGDSCEFAHGVFECWLHPSRYRTQPCKDGSGCRRRVCFFAHTPDQLRVVSPNGVNSSESSESPFRRKTLSFSPPDTPTGEMSPPMSPMTQSLSRSLGSSTINEMVANFRNLQLEKMKSLPSSWNMQMGGSPVYGSPRGSVLRSGFYSLPTTPTQTATRRGHGCFDLFDRVSEEDEEPVMERVESGRDLRMKMFERLSKENSLERADPDSSVAPPDVGWVSELVK